MDFCYNMTFLASRCPPRQNILSVTSVASSCPASTWSRQDVLLRCKKVKKQLAHSGNTRNC